MLIIKITKQRKTIPKSTITTQGESVVPLPGRSARRPGLVVQVSFSTKTPVLLAGGCKSSELPVLVDWIADPVDSRVIANRIMGNVDQDHLIVFVGRILVDPVRVENPQTTQLSPCSFFCN